MNNGTSERVITLKQVRELVPYSAVHLARLEKRGLFPRRIQLSSHRVGWSLNEILEWIEEKKQSRPSPNFLKKAVQ